jgi:hypothetical protein
MHGLISSAQQRAVARRKRRQPSSAVGILYNADA